MTKLIFAVIVFLFQYNYTLEQHLIEIIKKDNVEALKKELENGLNVNTTMVRELPLLLFALGCSANKIAQLLILKKANVNAVFTVNEFKMTPLFLGLRDNKISVETIRLLLENGADINNILITSVGKFLNNKIMKFSIFHCFEHNTDEKILFIINYLIKHYEKDVLPIALSHNSSLFVISQLIEQGAFIPSNIIEIANKLKVKKKIINYLQRQFDINKTILEAVKCLPYELVGLISSYSVSHEQTIDQLLLDAIADKDIHFIKQYLKNGGNPNYVIKYKNNRWPLFVFAICSKAEEIAIFLMESGADINKQGQLERKSYHSGLLMALALDLSINFIERILNHGTDINNIGCKRSTLKNQYYNLAYALCEDQLCEEKRCFVFDYLLKRFGQNVLDFVLESETELPIIKAFIGEGANVTRHIVEKAKKLGHSKEIVKYLNGILQLNEQLRLNDIKLTGYPLTLINDYHCIEENTNQESNKCIVC